MEFQSSFVRKFGSASGGLVNCAESVAAIGIFASIVSLIVKTWGEYLDF